VGAVALLALAAAVAVLLLTGGDDSNESAEAIPGEWVELESAPLSQVEMGSARIRDEIYAAGGLLPPGESTNQVARYDIDADRWGLVAPMPIAVDHSGVAAAGGKLYVHGGYTEGADQTSATDALSAFDPGTGRWTELTPSPKEQAAHTMAAVDGKLYAIGGVRDSVQRRIVQVYDIASDSWSGGPTVPEPGRDHIGSAVIGDRIYILGGRHQSPGELPVNFDLVDFLDTSTGTWTRVAPMATERSGFEAERIRDRIVVAGGEEVREGGDTIGEAELYDPATDTWTPLPPLPTPRHGSGVSARGRTVYVFEGGPEQALSFSTALEALEIPRKAFSSP
jgi:N-acetylneuraminic acid mutarotase